jgi:hypothetical protein
LAESSPGLEASLGAVPLELDRQYRFSAPELKLPWPFASSGGFGSLDEGSRELLSSLPLQQLEQLAEDLLDFTEPADLQAWFDDHPAG